MSNFIERPRYTCALGGALATVTALPKTIPIMHSSSGCAGNLAWTQFGGSGLQVGGYCGALSVPSSCIKENEVVFGGDERLREIITHTLEVMEGNLYFVLTGCVTDMIGDDIRSVVREFQEEGAPIISAETGGFKGDSYRGYELVLKALFQEYVEEGKEKIKGQVNLWGIVPGMDVFWRGNLLGLRSLLEKLGLEVNTFFTHNDSLEKIKNAASAQLNIVVSDVYGREAAEDFKRIHGTPYLNTPLPIGPQASEEFLRLVAENLGLATALVEQVIAEEKRIYYSLLAPLTECYNDMDLQRYAIIVGDSNYSPALTKFLADDLGWLPELVLITDQLRKDQENLLLARFNSLESGLNPLVVFEKDTSQVLTHLNRFHSQYSSEIYHDPISPAFVVGSSLDRDLALTLKASHLSISFPVANRGVINRGYTGYTGGLTLIEDLLSAIITVR